MTSPSTVGYMFILEYYGKLNADPHHLYQFYTKQSTVSHAFDEYTPQVARGQAEVQKLIQREKFLHNCTVVVSNVDYVESLQGGIVIQVVGEMSNESRRHNFSQTFFLAQQPKGYFVLNDILHIQGECDPQDVPEAQEADHAFETAAGSAGGAAGTGTYGTHAGAHAGTHAQAEPPKLAAAESLKSQPPTSKAAGAPPAASLATDKPKQKSKSATAAKVFYSAYLKNVGPAVNRDALRQSLQAAGEVTHLQIEPEKARAFVDFIDQKSLDKALAMQKVVVGGHEVYIEPRKRRKPTK